MSKRRGLYIILYGGEGMGKTSLALQFPGPRKVYSINEVGYENLDMIDKVPSGSENIEIDTHPQLIEELSMITDSDETRTVILDSTSGYCQIMREDILKEIYSKDDAGQNVDPERQMRMYGMFSEGDRVYAPMWIALLEEECLRLQAIGVNVIIIGHTKIAKVKSATTNDFQGNHINIPEWPRDVLTKSAQAVLYYTLDFTPVTTRAWKGKATESKVTENQEVRRIIYTQKHPSHSAKNCLNLPAYIWAGDDEISTYEEFVSKLPTKLRDQLNG